MGLKISYFMANENQYFLYIYSLFEGLYDVTLGSPQFCNVVASKVW